MRILFLTCHLPLPAISGGRLREFELLRRLAPRHDVHVVAVTKTLEDDLAKAGRLHELGMSTTVVRAGTDRSPTLADQPVQVRRHASAEARALLTDLVGWADVVHVEGFYLHGLLPDPCPTPVLLDEQNVECDLWRQRARLAGDDGHEREAEAEAERTCRAEVAAWRAADLCAAVTPEDAAAMVALAPGLDVRVVPDGVCTPAGPVAVAAPERPTVVFVGNFAYEPNVDGARWLCTEVVPRLRAVVPDVHVRLVGNAPPPDVRAFADGTVEVTGRVPSVTPHVAAAHVVACPLRIGGGIKVKMLEALGLGKAAVATSVAAQGLAAARHAFVVADDADRFAGEVARLLVDPEARRRLEREALRSMVHLPSWDDAADALEDAYLVLAGGRRRDQRPDVDDLPA